MLNFLAKLKPWKYFLEHFHKVIYLNILQH